MISVTRPIGMGSLALSAATIGLIALHSIFGLFAGPMATMIACAGILILGLPHGTLDLQLIRQDQQAGKLPALLILCVYIAFGLAMWGLWMALPVTALCVFLVVASIHFSEDWEETNSSFLSIALSLAILCSPTLFHAAALQDIFAALTGTTDSHAVGEVMRLLAPVSLAIALVGLGVLVQARQYDTTIAASCSLLATLFLPPTVGFAVFFCLHHSPQHFREALASLRKTSTEAVSTTVVFLTAVSLMLAAGLFLLNGGSVVPLRLASATFMCLSILTVPHMMVPLVIAAAGRSRDRSGGRPWPTTTGDLRLETVGPVVRGPHRDLP